MAKTLKFDNGVVNLGTSISGAVGAISAGANSVGAGTVVFSDSNGVTFGLNGSTVTASVAAGGGGRRLGSAPVRNPSARVRWCSRTQTGSRLGCLGVPGSRLLMTASPARATSS